MKYSRLKPWPFIDPDALPEGCIEVGESVDWDRSSGNNPKRWLFFVQDSYLIINRKSWVYGFNGEPGEYVISQYEYPIAGARWFVDTINRFQLHPDDPSAVPRGNFNVRAKVDGESLGVTRGAGFGYTGPDGTQIPGYSFDNINRIEHSSSESEGHRCQMFEMGDPWLFEHGLLELFEEIAERHERGEI